jgi:DUF4097 and DUF4098 domain-containing protein YvlB
MDTQTTSTQNTDPREQKNRGWIVIVALAVLLGCGLLTVGSALLGWLSMRPGSERVEVQASSQRVERTFEVGSDPELVVNNSAGNVYVTAGETGAIEIVATKKNGTVAQLDSIEVILTQNGDRISVETRRPFGLNRGSVEYQITVPASTQVRVRASAGSITVRGTTALVDVESSAGSVTVSDTTGAIVARASAGSIDVRDAVGSVDLRASAGSINYAGAPTGECRLDSSAGSIKIALPERANVTLDMTTSAGRITLDTPVQGTVTRSEVRGTLGTGADATLTVRASAGSITITR